MLYVSSESKLWELTFPYFRIRNLKPWKSAANLAMYLRIF